MPMPRRSGGRSRPRRPKAAAAASGFEETACATQVGLLGCDLLFHPLGLRLQVGEIFFQLVDPEAVEILGLRLARKSVVRGQRVSVRVALGGRRITKKQKERI